jgi:hypothetical protein
VDASVWDDAIIDAIFGTELKDAPGKPRARRWHANFIDGQPSPGTFRPRLEVQCDWLQEAGFESVECFHKLQELAIFRRTTARS